MELQIHSEVVQGAREGAGQDSPVGAATRGAAGRGHRTPPP